MADSEVVEVLQNGTDFWNKWRCDNPNVRIDLSDINLETDLHSYQHHYDLPHFEGYDFSAANLNRTSARNSTFVNCNFSRSHLHFSDLCFSFFQNCDFSKAGLNVSKIGSAQFINCNFTEAQLSYCSAEETDFTGSNLTRSKLNNMSLVKTNFSNTIINQARVYGISAWDLNMSGSTQNDLFVEETQSRITVPSIELAQFVSLLISNAKIRDVIDTITSKVVLILGRFSSTRKPFLDSLKSDFQRNDCVPIVFDFDGPTSRDLTETILTLAAMSKFVVVDLSDPRSVPQELATIIPNLPSVPVQPIIDSSQKEYGMFEHFERYPWVLKVVKHDGKCSAAIAAKIQIDCEKYIQDSRP